MRSEIGKIEATMAKLLLDKEKLVTLNPSADLVAVNEQFNSRVVDEVANCKRIALEYVKEDTTASVTAVDTGGGDRRSSFSATKRETVMLP